MSVCSHSDEELAYPLNTNFPSSRGESPISLQSLEWFSRFQTDHLQRLFCTSQMISTFENPTNMTRTSYPAELGIKTIQKLLENTSFMGEHISLQTLLLHPCWSYEASGTLTKIQRTVIIYGTQTNSKVKRSGRCKAASYTATITTGRRKQAGILHFPCVCKFQLPWLLAPASNWLLERFFPPLK